MDKNIRDLIIYLDEIDIPYEKKIHTDDKLTFGAEIEFYSKNFYNSFCMGYFPEFLYSQEYENNFNKWIYKLESSVDDNFGYEINSPIMHDRIKCWNELAEILDYVKKYKTYSTEKCGGHIHFGANYFNENCQYYKTLLKLWVCYEPIIYKFFAGDKANLRKYIDKYAKSINYPELNKLNKEEDLNNFLYSFNNILLNNTTENNYVRNYGFNVSNIIDDSKNTFELRCPNGSLNPIIWQNNIKFFSNVMTSIKNNKIDLDFLNFKFSKRNFNNDLTSFNNTYLKEPIELADMIFDKEENKYYFLKQYYKLDYSKTKKLERILK